MGAARSMDAPLGLQRHLTVPLFATSAVTGSGIPLLHAFLASLRSTAQQPASALASAAPMTCATLPCLGHVNEIVHIRGPPHKRRNAQGCVLRVLFCAVRSLLCSSAAAHVLLCYMRRHGSLVKLLTGFQFCAFCMQDGDDASGSSRSQLVADCPPGEASVSEASASDAYSMFALSLDNDSCRSPEVLGATPPANERTKRNLYMPEQRPLVHFQVGRTSLPLH